MTAPLAIIIVETDRTRAQLIVDSLRQAGDFDIFVIAEVTGLARQIKARNPDIVLIDIENPSRDTMEELTLASGPLDRPVAMFVDRSEDGLSTAAIEAGGVGLYRRWVAIAAGQTNPGRRHRQISHVSAHAYGTGRNQKGAGRTQSH